MKRISYETLKDCNYRGYIKEGGAEKVMQFGEGNFLRAFVDYWFDCANEYADWDGKIVIVQPIAEGLTDAVNEQEGLYTLYLRGSEGGREVNERRVISSVSRCINPYEDFDAVLEAAVSDDLEVIVSNTTEAGIVHDMESTFDQRPPFSFPAKLTRILYERYRAGKPGVIILSCELIDNNGKELQSCVEQYIRDWGLPEEFRTWIREENLFCSTLVDRIVPGRIRDRREAESLHRENGYRDELMVVGECFGVWMIEGPKELTERLPFRRAGLPVHVVADVTPYKHRKVRILNGAHTGFVLGAYLAGFEIVRDCMHDEIVRGFMEKLLYEEVIPTLRHELDETELKEFAAAVEDRFRNPFIDHALLSISLNSTSKWRARNLPSLLAYVEETRELPPCLVMSLAAYIAFYSSGILRREADGLICRREKGNEYKVSDDARVLDFYYGHREDGAEELVHAVLSEAGFWGRDLTEIAGLEMAAAEGLKKIRTQGARAAYASCLSNVQTIA